MDNIEIAYHKFRAQYRGGPRFGQTVSVRDYFDAGYHVSVTRIAELEAENARLRELIQLGEKGFVTMPEHIKTADQFAKWAKGFAPRGVEAYPKHRGENHLRKELDSYKAEQEGE